MFEAVLDPLLSASLIPDPREVRPAMESLWGCVFGASVMRMMVKAAKAVRTQVTVADLVNDAGASPSG